MSDEQVSPSESVGGNEPLYEYRVLCSDGATQWNAEEFYECLADARYEVEWYRNKSCAPHRIERRVIGEGPFEWEDIPGE